MFKYFFAHSKTIFFLGNFVYAKVQVHFHEQSHIVTFLVTSTKVGSLIICIKVTNQLIVKLYRVRVNSRLKLK